MGAHPVSLVVNIRFMHTALVYPFDLPPFALSILKTAWTNLLMCSTCGTVKTQRHPGRETKESSLLVLWQLPQRLTTRIVGCGPGIPIKENKKMVIRCVGTKNEGLVRAHNIPKHFRFLNKVSVSKTLFMDQEQSKDTNNDNFLFSVRQNSYVYLVHNNPFYA